MELALGVLTALATLAAAAAAYFSYKTSKNAYITDIYKTYFGICNQSWATDDDKKRCFAMIVDFCEYLCFLLSTKKVEQKEIDPLVVILKNVKCIEKVKETRIEKPETFVYYFKWLRENNLL